MYHSLGQEADLDGHVVHYMLEHRKPTEPDGDGEMNQHRPVQMGQNTFSANNKLAVFAWKLYNTAFCLNIMMMLLDTV